MSYRYFIAFLRDEVVFSPASVHEFVSRNPGNSTNICLFLSNNECIGETVVIESWGQFLTKKMLTNPQKVLQKKKSVF